MSIVETMGATLAEAYGPDVEFGDMARAALRAVKPEDVTDDMTLAAMNAFYEGAFTSDDLQVHVLSDAFRRAIAAAIAAGAEQ